MTGISQTEALASSYQDWLAKHEPSLFCPDNQLAERIEALSHRPVLSILLPTFNTNLRFLELCICSVLKQRYPNWQLCVVDDSSSDPRVIECIRSFAENESRIQVYVNSTNSGISASSNQGLAMAAGEFIILLDHDDELHPFALFEVAAALDAQPDIDLIYSDEDKIDPDGQRVCPAFKPDFDMDIFLSFDYLGHMIALRRRLAIEVEGFRTACNGAQDWDLLVRVFERIQADKVHHIPKPLYHWRMHAESTALDRGAKPYVQQAWNKVLLDHLQRTRSEAEVQPGLFFGTMRLKRPAPQKTQLAIFLRTEDGAYQQAVLAPNVDWTRTTFYELLGSSVTCGAAGEEKWIWSLEDIPADVLVFINRPLEAVNHVFLDELVAQSMRDDCGLVSGLSVDISRVIHSGMVRDSGGQLIDPFVGLPYPSNGYLGFLSVVREVETISDEFFAIRREYLEAVGGLGSVSASFMPRLLEQLTANAQTRGLRVLVTPYAVATFEGVWPARPRPTPPKERGGIRLNPNFASFANLAEVFSGNL